jgi:hypothetical protein
LFVGLIRFVTTKNTGTYDSVTWYPQQKTDSITTGATTTVINYGNDWNYSGTTFSPGTTAAPDGITSPNVSTNDVEYTVVTPYTA